MSTHVETTPKLSDRALMVLLICLLPALAGVSLADVFGAKILT